MRLQEFDLLQILLFHLEWRCSHQSHRFCKLQTKELLQKKENQMATRIAMKMTEGSMARLPILSNSADLHIKTLENLHGRQWWRFGRWIFLDKWVIFRFHVNSQGCVVCLFVCLFNDVFRTQVVSHVDSVESYLRISAAVNRANLRWSAW